MGKKLRRKLLAAVSVTLALILFAAAPFTMGIQAGGDPAPAAETVDVWDGETVTIGWYTEHQSDSSFTLSKASDLAGLAYLVAHRDCYIYYDASGKVDSPKEFYEASQADKSGLMEINGKTIGKNENGKDDNGTQILSFRGVSIKLDADLDLAGKPYTPVGTSASFGGHFDGQNHTISNVYVTPETATHHYSNILDFGLFGSIAWGGSVSNLTIQNETLDATGSGFENSSQTVNIGGVLSMIHSTGGDGAKATNVTVNGLTVKIGKRTAGRTNLGAVTGQYPNAVNQPFDKITVNCYVVTNEGTTTVTKSGKNFYGDCGGGTAKDALFTDSSVTVGHGAAATTWSSDGTNHWHNCVRCGNPLEETVVAHNPTEWKQTEDNTKHYQVCECGYQTVAVAHDSLSYEPNDGGETHKVTCDTCDLEVNAAEAHTWEWKDNPANPDKEEIATCTKCEATGQTRVKHTHVPNKVEKKDPTCTEDGNPEYYTCTGENGVCDGKYYKDATCTSEYTAEEIVLKATGHNKGTGLTKHDAKAATCTEDGNSEYYSCEVCGKYFKSADGKEEIADKGSVVLKATGHNKGAGLTKHDAKAATCQAEGNIEYYSCEVCGKYFKVADGKEEITDKGSVTLAKTAHSYKDGVCTVCGEADPNYTAPDTSDRLLISGAVLLTAVSGIAVIGLVSKKKKS